MASIGPHLATYKLTMPSQARLGASPSGRSCSRATLSTPPNSMTLERPSAPGTWRTTTSACTTERRLATAPSAGAIIGNLSLIEIVIQAARVKALQAAYRAAEAKKLKENPPNATQIRNLGLLDKEDDTKKVLGSS